MRKFIGTVSDYPEIQIIHSQFKTHAEFPQKQIEVLHEKIAKLRMDAYETILIILKNKSKLPVDWNAETDGVVINVEENSIIFERSDGSSSIPQFIKDMIDS